MRLFQSADLKSFATVAGLILSFAASSWAQSVGTTGTIQVTIVDSTGAPIPDARATARQPESGTTRQAQSNELGQFRFTGLAIGSYEVTVEKEGFGAVVAKLQVSVGQTVVQRIEMKPATLTETLEVKEQTEALDPTATTSGATLSNERIEEAPAQNRNYLNFVLVAPGAAAASGSNPQRAGAGVRSAAPDSGFSFGGMRPRNNSLSIDGVDNRDETTGGNRVAVGLEMVDEFRVAGTTLGAEFGGAAGGVVNVVTRSGTNRWHGDWTFFGQNEAVNARDPEAETSHKPRFRRYQPGTSINGPIRRDRTFFSMAVEQEFESSDEWSEVPADAAAAINQVLARPDLARAALRRVDRGLFRAGSDQTEFSFKLNHQLNNTNALSARYAFSHGRISHDVQGVEDFTEGSSRGSSLTNDHSFVAGWISVPSPTVVNDLRLQVAQRSVGLHPNSAGAMIEIPGVTTFGQAYGLDGSRNEKHEEVVESLNVTFGQHHLSFGGSLHAIQLDARLADRFGGVFIFPTLTSFLQERPDVFLQAFGDARTNFSTLPVGAWAQDRWEVLSGLTVEAGLRYDYEPLPSGFTAPGRNLAPRLGVAFRPHGRGALVFRAGFGLFYDRYPLAYLNNAVQKDGVHGYEQYLTGDAAAAAFLLGRSGSLPGPVSGAPVSIYRPDANFPATYSRKFTAGAERSFGPNTTLTAEFQSVRGFHLPRIRNAALALPPQFQLEQTARSSYNGVSVSLNRRMAKELAFLAAYTAGRTWDDGSDYDEQPFDPRNTRLDWALSRQHQAQRFAASAVFNLPVEDLHGAPGWLRETLENVTVAPIFTAGSGRPINTLDTTDTFRTGAFPITARPFGLPRNPYLGPGTVSFDLRVMKGIWIEKNRMILQFGVESFNLGNHSNPARVSPYYAAGGSKLASYNQPVETLNARQLQLVFQIEY